MLAEKGAEFYWPVRVYYEDTDAGGVVYYANYLKFLERARTEMLRSVGFEQDQLKQEQGLIFAVHSLAIKYEKPAVFNDELMITSSITSLRRASLGFTQRIHRQSDQLPLCTAEIVVACLNAERFSACAMPDDIILKLKQSR
jgi:acyl-CoA thioester hydrolase